MGPYLIWWCVGLVRLEFELPWVHRLEESIALVSGAGSRAVGLRAAYGYRGQRRLGAIAGSPALCGKDHRSAQPFDCGRATSPSCDSAPAGFQLSAPAGSIRAQHCGLTDHLGIIARRRFLSLLSSQRGVRKRNPSIPYMGHLTHLFRLARIPKGPPANLLMLEIRIFEASIEFP